jgi:hypothetical protein
VKTSMALNATKLRLFAAGGTCPCITYCGPEERRSRKQLSDKVHTIALPVAALTGIRIASSYSYSLMFFAAESSIRDSIHIRNSGTTTETSRTRVSPIRS